MASAVRFERHEYKYWIPEALTAEIGRFIAPYVEPDPYSARAPERQYTITSIYLDTPRWSMYEDSLADRPSRHKLRVRTYGPDSEGPVTVEVKRKIKDVIVKSRAFLPRDRYPAVLQDPDEPEPRFDSGEEAEHFRDFVFRMTVSRAQPRMLVRYTREAYESRAGDYARVTFDRKMACQPADGFDLRGDPRAWVSGDGLRENGFGALTALELKCESVFPSWLFHLVRTFDLQRSAFSKYVSAVSAERERRWAGPGSASRSLVAGG